MLDKKIVDIDYFDYAKFIASLIELTQSKNVVEIGVQEGKSTEIFCEATRKIGGKLFGYDMWCNHEFYNAICDIQDVKNKLYSTGFTDDNFQLTKINSYSDEFSDVLREQIPELIDLAFIDGDHSYAGIKNDFLKIYPLLKHEGIIVFHDTFNFAGCRKFVYDLYETYSDGTFDIINLPYGMGSVRAGLTVLVKRSFGFSNCGMNATFEKDITESSIYELENEWHKKQLLRKIKI